MTGSNTKQCPFCAEEIQAAAIKCRHCRERLDGNAKGKVGIAPAVDQQPPVQKVSGTDVLNIFKLLPGLLGSVLILFIILVCTGTLNFHKDGSTVNTPISNLSFVDFDSQFCAQSRSTDLQKGEAIKQLKGQRVRWEGIVSHVSEGEVGIKHKASTATWDVRLKVIKVDAGQLASLNEGERVQYEGTIEDYGTITSHDLIDGKIVSHGPISQHDAIMLLTSTETEVLQRIVGNGGER